MFRVWTPHQPGFFCTINGSSIRLLLNCLPPKSFESDSSDVYLVCVFSKFGLAIIAKSSTACTSNRWFQIIVPLRFFKFLLSFFLGCRVFRYCSGSQSRAMRLFRDKISSLGRQNSFEVYRFSDGMEFFAVLSYRIWYQKNSCRSPPDFSRFFSKSLTSRFLQKSENPSMGAKFFKISFHWIFFQ